MIPGESPSASAQTFPPTAWSMVRLAVAEGRPGADQALDQLFRIYERPVLVCILRRGYAPDAAGDLKQAFFEHLLSKNSLAAAEGTRVKLRAFLITKLQAFLIDQYRKETAQKRGAGSVDRMADLSADQADMAQPVDWTTPVTAFQRQWMETLAAEAMRRLRDSYTAGGNGILFDCLAPFITQSSDESLMEVSDRLGRPVGTLKSDISRMRAKCQQLIREQIADTLDDPTPEAISAELRDLMGG